MRVVQLWAVLCCSVLFCADNLATGCRYGYGTGMSDSKTNNDFAAVDESAERLDRLADFFNEVGMLRHTPRTGYAFLGTGQENVAEHSYRVSVMGYVLARMCGMDPARVTSLC